MTNRRTFLSAVGATAASAAVPRFATAQGGARKLALYANVGPVLTHYDVDVENATLTARGYYARRHRAVLLAAS